MNAKARKILQFLLFLGLTVLFIWAVNHFGLSQLREQVDQLGVWAPLGLFVLRFSSILFPALPGTAYSILGGTLFGFGQGLAIVCLADLASCSLNFALSRRYGRGLVQRLVGDRWISKVDALAQQHLENNFFLMVGFLMTGFFDFVAYGVGLTKTPALKFFPALFLSIAISNPPIVAIGAGLFEKGKLLLGLALLGTFGLAIVTGYVRSQSKIDTKNGDHLE